MRLSSNFQGSFVLVSFVPHCMNEISSAKKWAFWAPVSLCHSFSVGSGGKLRMKSVHEGREDPVEDCCSFCFLTIQQPFKIKSYKENDVFWKNGVKTCPADEFLPSCEKARNSVAYQLCVCTTVKILCGAKIRFFYCRWLLKKQSTKTKKHFFSSKLNFIGKRRSNDRQWPNWKGNLAVHST